MRKTWKIIKTIFYVAIIFGSIFIIVTSFNLFGFQAFVVKSGSMEPKIQTGSVVIDQTKTDYKSQDIITFKISDSQDTVTHRITKVNQDADVISYQVKGDANATPDPDPVLKTNVVGSVLFSIPFLGFLIAFIRTIPGLIIFIAIPALIIVSEEIGNVKTEVKKIINKNKGVNQKVTELAKRESELEAKEERLNVMIRDIQKQRSSDEPKPK